MNAKKVEEISEKKKNPIVASIDFFGSIKRELKTITWTTKAELKKFTKVILISTFASGFLVYVGDLFIQKVLSTVSLLTRLIFG